MEVARWCLALLLIKDRDARHRFEKQGSVNSFCDAALVKDALFWNAGILSGDGGVRRMARFCKLTALRELESVRVTGISHEEFVRRVEQKRVQ